MRTIGTLCLAVAAFGASPCPAVDWEINLESRLQGDFGLSSLDRADYRGNYLRDRTSLSLLDPGDVVRAEAVFRPSRAGALDWELAIAASARPTSRTDGDFRGRHRGLDDLDSSLTLRATIRPRPARPTR